MVRGLIREGFQGKEAEPGGPGQKGRDVRWRLSAGGVERGVVGTVHGAGRSSVW